ncbi:subtilisin-like protein [Penicillium capsulatum]|uniref:Subtilisin-like protein n=1 Tax=Penicillium capsulatum TaxID=69766 RepID=A0A9W9IBG9_9EURO|nr:subtilisin-like protein [Penicillium capsulatum]KAJ6135914.1 subtilisin-like protein [Penicillium capsulatum]
MNSSNNPAITERDTKFKCIVSPADGRDSDLTGRLEEKLKTITQESSIYSFVDDTENELNWWIVDLTAAQLETIKSSPDVKYAARRANRVRSKANTFINPDPYTNSTFLPRSLRRDNKQKAYKRQTMAPTELVTISIPPGQDFCRYSDYVYPTEAGEKIRIYVIEDGINEAQTKEFPKNRVAQTLKTLRATHSPDANGPDDHSTCVASKAMGTNFGTAKSGILVPVQTGDDSWASVSEGLLEVRKDIQQKLRKRDTEAEKAVLVFSLMVDEIHDPNKEQEPSIDKAHTYLGQIMNLGVPTVTVAGNAANDERPKIDAVPSVWGSDDFPLIVAGNAEYDGSRREASQEGDQLTVYACGTDVSCQGVEDEIIGSGTSYAAPMTAGVLATLMSQKSGKFYDATKHLSGLDFVQAARKFLKEEASWERKKGINMLWNLVPLSENEPEEEDDLDSWLGDDD